MRAAGAGKVSGGRGNGSSEKWCASCLCSGRGELGREKARGLPAQSGAPVTCALAMKNWVVVT